MLKRVDVTVTASKMAFVSKATRLGASYWRLWWANGINNVGNGVFVVAMPLLAVSVSRDPREVSAISAATYLPWLLISLPAGAIVDRHDRATLMCRFQAVQAAITAGIAVAAALGKTSIAVLAVAGFGLGSAEVIINNAAQAVLPQVVPAQLLPQANGNQYVVMTVGQSFLGPPLGSLLFALAVGLPFGLDAASFAVSAALLAQLPRIHPDEQSGPAVPMRSAVWQGLRWLGRHRLLRTLALVLGMNMFCNQMGFATLVLLATGSMHLSDRGYGLLLASAAVGSVLGGLINARVSRLIGPIPAVAISLAINALSYVGAGLATSPMVLAVLLALSGLAGTLWNVVTVSMRQRIIPAELLGRVNSVYRMVGWGLVPLGALAGGFTASEFGLHAPFLVAGVLRAGVLLAVLPVLVRESASP